MPVTSLKNGDDFKKLINDSKAMVLFTADWAEQCKQIVDVMEDLSKMLNEMRFIQIKAEDFPEISMAHSVEAVPTTIFYNKGEQVDRVEGVNIALITGICKKLGAPLEERLKSLINAAPIMIFMKGTRQVPRCGFSQKLIDILNETKLPYETFDILSDEEVRQGLKTYSDWPTYPQVYVNGELIGGLDIINELRKSNELEKTLKGDSV